MNIKEVINFFLHPKTIWAVIFIGIISFSIFTFRLDDHEPLSIFKFIETISSGILMFWGPIFLAFVYKKKDQNRFSRICLSIVCLPTIYTLTAIAIHIAYDTFTRQVDPASMIISLVFIGAPIKLIIIGIVIGFIVATIDDIVLKQLKEPNTPINKPKKNDTVQELKQPINPQSTHKPNDFEIFILSTKLTWIVIAISYVFIFFALFIEEKNYSFDYENILSAILGPLIMLTASLVMALIYQFINIKSEPNIFKAILCLPIVYIFCLFSMYSFVVALSGSSLNLFPYLILPFKVIPLSALISFVCSTLNKRFIRANAIKKIK